MFRVTGAAEKMDQLLRRKKKELGLTPVETLESMFALWTTSGERSVDLKSFRQDIALAHLHGHRLPARQTARDFFDSFEPKVPTTVWSGEKSVVTAESARLAALVEVKDVQPIRLRFLIFNEVGHLVQHARGTLLRMVRETRQRLIDLARIRIHLRLRPAY